MLISNSIRFLNIRNRIEHQINRDEKPVPLVLLSGGFDSTYLTQEALKESNVDILYVKGAQHPLKIECELTALETIVHSLNADSDYRIRNCFLCDMETLGMRAMTFEQIGYWMFAALHTYDEKLHNKVIMSFVSGDSIATKLMSLKYSWDYLTFACKRESIPLEFPLQHVTKNTILRKIRQELIPFTWSCETPIKAPSGTRHTACGECAALQSYKVDLHSDVQIAYVQGDSALPILNNVIYAWDQLAHTVKKGTYTS